MTLDTSIYLNEYHDPETLFAWVNKELLRAEGEVLTTRKPGSLMNAPGQGFSAWASLKHNEGKPFEGPYGDDPDRDWYDSDEDFQRDVIESQKVEDMYRKQYIGLYFDTGYAYSGPEGSASGLHALFICKLREHLPESTTITWQNEFTGEWHENFEGLEEFLGGGESAKEWLDSIARPAIEASLPPGTVLY